MSSSVEVMSGTWSPGLCLFAEPCLAIAGELRPLPDGGKRLVAYAALHGGRVERRQVAGALWPVGDDVRAVGNLRSALWRLRAAGLEVLDADKRQVWVRAGIEVDADLVSRWAVGL